MKTYLLVNESEESDLALKYLRQQNINPQVHQCTEEQLKEGFSDDCPVPLAHAVLFANSDFLGESNLPFLIVRDSEDYRNWGYASINGVKSFLRKKMSGLSSARFEQYHSPFWRVPINEAFYPKVTCFNESQEKIFQGDLKETPYDFSVLDLHDFKSWHESSCWKIGSLEELSKKQDENGIVKDSKTKTVLFPHDVEMLKKGEVVPFIDRRNMYQVTFEAYFKKGGDVFGIYADMLD